MSEGLVPARARGVTVMGGDGDYEPYGPTPAPPKNPLERPLAAVRRYKWMILAIVALATTAGVIGTRFITPQYEVRATLWVASETPNGRDRVGPIRTAELLAEGAWIELFRSFRVVDQVVRKLALYLEPANPADRPTFQGFALADRFLPGTYELTIDRAAGKWALRNAAGVTVETGAATDSVGKRVGFLWQLPATAFGGSGSRTIQFNVATPRETSLKMLDRLKNRLQDGSNFLWLTYQDDNPQLAAGTLNTWLHEYIAVASDLKRRNVVEFADILGKQLRYAEKATQDAEAAYQRFRVNTITLPTDGVPVAAQAAGAGDRDPALTSFFEQKIEHDNLRNDREALEKTIRNAASGAAPYEGMLLIPSVAQSPGAEALRNSFRTLYELQARLRVERQSYTDEYPAVRDLIASIDVLQRQTIPQLASQLLAQLRSREQDFERRISSASRELQEIPPRTIEERRLSRAVAVSEGLYTDLKGRFAEAQLAAASATPDVSVLDTAVAPQRPTANTAPRLMLMAFAGGLGAALALALLLDTVDRRIRYADQVSSDLGLVIAGTVPRVPKGGISASSPEQVLQFVESFRSLRMHVRNPATTDRLALAVSSAAPGDGKSLVSSNLALSFAEAGLRTVLVDGDTRRGSLHKMFGLTLAGGLTEYLAGTADLATVVRATPHQNLSFVSCGRRHPRSPELLATPRLKQLVDSLSQTFDVVIFDTPPLAAGIDGYAISAATGNILMVLRMGQTERRLAAAKLAVLDRLPVEVVGAVLNGVPLTGEFQYYAYSSGYAIESGEPGGDSGGELVVTGPR